MTDTEIMLHDSLKEYGIPEHMHHAAADYILRGIHPGHFLSAVISNDLAEAVARADAENQRRLVQWVKWLYNEAPSTCWGSPDRLRQWVQKFARERQEQVEAREGR